MVASSPANCHPYFAVPAEMHVPLDHRRHAGLRARDAAANPQSNNPLAPKAPMFAPKAKRVIYLHMPDSPSQLELFDYKPELQKLYLKDAPPSFLAGKRFAFIKGVLKMLAGQFKFQQHGQSGQWVSELLPHFAKVGDKTCVIRTVNTDQFNEDCA